MKTGYSFLERRDGSQDYAGEGNGPVGVRISILHRDFRNQDEETMEGFFVL